MVLHAEFVPVGASSGPTQELNFKVLPKGSCKVPGVIIGFPALVVAPYGLEWVVRDHVRIFRP